MTAAIGAILLLYAGGCAFSSLFRKGSGILFAGLTALPSGMVLLGVVGCFVYALPLGSSLQWAAPLLYSLVSIVCAVILMIRFPLSIKEMSVVFLGLLLCAGTAALFLKLRMVTMTADSFYLARFAQNAGSGHHESWHYLLTMWGPLAPVLHASTLLINQKLLYFLSPLLAVNMLALFFYGNWRIAYFHLNLDYGRSVAVGSVATLILAASNLFLFHSFYIHVNLLSGLYIYLFALCWFMSTRPSSQERGLIVMAIVALTGFSLLRLEAPIAAMVFLLLALSLFSSSYRQRIAIALPLVAVLLFWNVYLLFTLPKARDLLGYTHITMNMLVFIITGIAVFLSNRKWLAALIPRVPQVIFIVLCAAALLATALKPHHMLESLSAIGANLFFVGHWGIIWHVVVFVTLFTLVRRLQPEETFFILIVLCFLLMIYILGYFRYPYEVTAFSSSNRMVLQVYPVACTFLMIRVVRCWYGRG